VQRHNDPLVCFAEEGFAGSMATVAPGKYLVNIVPALKYIPEWMPGAEFHRVAKKVRDDLDRLREEPYQATVGMMVSRSFLDSFHTRFSIRNTQERCIAPTSFISETLGRHRQRPDFEFQARIAKQTATMVFGGMLYSISSAILKFELTTSRIETKLFLRQLYLHL
jgi:hypothetical protein